MSSQPSSFASCADGFGRGTRSGPLAPPEEAPPVEKPAPSPVEPSPAKPERRIVPVPVPPPGHPRRHVPDIPLDDPKDIQPQDLYSQEPGSFWEQIPVGLRRVMIDGLKKERSELERHLLLKYGTTEPSVLFGAVAELLADIESIEADHKPEILAVIRQATENRYGDALPRLRIDISNDLPSVPSDTPSAGGAKIPELPANQDEGLIHRTELRNLWQQGEGWLGMKEFSFGFEKEINAIVAGLAEKYQELDRLYRFGQLAQLGLTSQEELAELDSLPKEVFSAGREIVTTEFELIDHPDGSQSVGVKEVKGIAVGKNGWAAAHEARKAACQMTTPNEGALRWMLPADRRERLNEATNSARAEIRQGIFGPAVVVALRKRLASILKEPLTEEAYLDIADGLFSMDLGAFKHVTDLLFSSDFERNASIRRETADILLQNQVIQPPMEVSIRADDISSPGSEREMVEPQLEEIESRLQFLLGLLRTHPNIVLSNLEHRQSLLETLADAATINEKLGEHAAQMRAGTAYFTKAVYSPAGDLSFNKEALRDFLVQRIEDLSGLNLLPGGSLAAQLAHLKQAANSSSGGVEEKRFKREAKQLMRLLPFLFDAHGEARFRDLSSRVEFDRIHDEILASEHQTLSNLYGDLWHLHFAPLVREISEKGGMGQVQQWFESLTNTFIAKTIQKVVTPVGVLGANATIRTLTLERVPNSVALFRGCYGGDCSLLSVPHYAILSASRTYFMRKEGNSTPAGYIFAVEVTVGNKRLPYIITANGATLTKSDVEIAVRMVGRDFGAREVIIGDLKANPHLVNFVTIREGFAALGGEAVEVVLPEGWGIIDRHGADIRGDRDTTSGLYSGDSIKKGLVVQLLDEDSRLLEPISQWEAEPTYQFYREPHEISLLERAILVNLETSGKHRKTMRKHLGLTKAQVQAAKPIVKMFEGRAITLKEFDAAHTLLGFGIENLLAVELETRAKILKRLSKAQPSILLHGSHLASERFWMGVARAYGLTSAELTRFIGMPEINESNVIAIISDLSRALSGNPSAIRSVLKSMSEDAREQMKTFIATALNERSLTDYAYGSRVIANLGSTKKENQLVALEAIALAQRGSPVVEALRDIASRISDTVRYRKILRLWLTDPQVSARSKAVMLRVNLAMDAASGEKIFELIPKSQHGEVNQVLRGYSNFALFKQLAAESGEDLIGSPQTFSFEPLYIPDAGLLVKLRDIDTAGVLLRGSKRDVLVEESFEIGVTAVTQEQYELVMGKNPSRFNGSTYPVESVMWSEAKAFAARLSALDPQYNYRLPTEAEWEIAARGGTATNYSYVNGKLHDYAWYFSLDQRERSSVYHHISRGSNQFGTHQVAQKRPNPNGLYDVHGNVYEWTLDRASESGVEDSDIEDPGVVTRGGSWSSDKRYVRSESRGYAYATGREDTIGFRLVRTPK